MCVDGKVLRNILISFVRPAVRNNAVLQLLLVYPTNIPSGTSVLPLRAMSPIRQFALQTDRPCRPRVLTTFPHRILQSCRTWHREKPMFMRSSVASLYLNCGWHLGNPDLTRIHRYLSVGTHSAARRTSRAPVSCLAAPSPLAPPANRSFL